jgi:serine/threonine protein kinase
MSKREKFGKFVLLEEVDTSALGTEFRAAKLGPSGFEKIVTVLRISPALSSIAEAAKSLMEQVKVAAQLQNPNILKIFGIGKVESSYYISFEFIEGRSLKAIFGRCRHEGFPFSVDHGLLIASKVCSALEYAHARRIDGGGRYFHGLLNPSSVLVSYEGEVRSETRTRSIWLPNRPRAPTAIRAPTSSRWGRSSLRLWWDSPCAKEARPRVWRAGWPRLGCRAPPRTTIPCRSRSSTSSPAPWPRIPAPATRRSRR